MFKLAQSASARSLPSAVEDGETSEDEFYDPEEQEFTQKWQVDLVKATDKLITQIKMQHQQITQKLQTQLDQFNRLKAELQDAHQLKSSILDDFQNLKKHLES